jgi:hypothetical protein
MVAPGTRELARHVGGIIEQRVRSERWDEWFRLRSVITLRIGWCGHGVFELNAPQLDTACDVYLLRVLAMKHGRKRSKMLALKNAGSPGSEKGGEESHK